VDTFWSTILWRQLGGAIDMLENAIGACPDELWSDRLARPEWDDRNVVGFWYVVYHALFFLDYYLADSTKAFRPPPPFTLDELDPAGLLPERPYSKEELQNYLEHCRTKARSVINSLTAEKAEEQRTFPSFEGSLGELLLVQVRHIQHHVGQLNLLLRQNTGSAPRWVRKTAG
jgi:DinB superfamily